MNVMTDYILTCKLYLIDTHTMQAYLPPHRTIKLRPQCQPSYTHDHNCSGACLAVICKLSVLSYDHLSVICFLASNRLTYQIILNSQHAFLARNTQYNVMSTSKNCSTCTPITNLYYYRTYPNCDYLSVYYATPTYYCLVQSSVTVRDTNAWINALWARGGRVMFNIIIYVISHFGRDQWKYSYERMQHYNNKIYDEEAGPGSARGPSSGDLRAALRYTVFNFFTYHPSSHSNQKRYVLAVILTNTMSIYSGDAPLSAINTLSVHYITPDFPCLCNTIAHKNKYLYLIFCFRGGYVGGPAGPLTYNATRPNQASGSTTTTESKSMTENDTWRRELSHKFSKKFVLFKVKLSWRAIYCAICISDGFTA